MSTNKIMFSALQTFLVAFSLLVGQATGQVLSPLNFFPGDTQIDPSPQTQDWPNRTDPPYQTARSPLQWTSPSRSGASA